MSQPKRPPPTLATEPVRRVEAGPWAIELLPGSAYSARYVASRSAIGFAFDSQRGLHAIGSDRVQPFVATPNSLAFVPAGCDVLSESPGGGEYLRVVHAQGLEVIGDHAFNNRIDPQAIALALRMRSALLRASVDDDWEAWALALMERAQGQDALAAPLRSSITASRLRLLDEFIDAGLGGPLSVQAMKSGAREFLTKPVCPETLLSAVAEALESDEANLQQRITQCELTARYNLLTPREQQVLEFIIGGLLIKQIAAELEVSEITIKVHKRQIMEKMRTKSITDLVRITERLHITQARSR